MPERIREVRAIWGTTFHTTYTAASNAAWNAGTAHKLPVTGIDLSKLEHKGIPSAVRQQRIWGHPAPKPGPTKSTLPLSIYMGKGSANLVAPVEATIASLFFGGLQSPPTAKTDECEADCTTTVIKATAHGALAGMCALIGARGDTRGNGEVRRIASVTANDFTLEMALSGAPSVGDDIVFSHTVYLKQATQNYIDLLVLGYHVEDQLQTLGCMGPLVFKGLAPGERPEMEMQLNVPGWQEVPIGERDVLTPETAPEGDGDSPCSESLGGFFFGDWGSTTRAAIDCADIAINPNFVFEEIPNRLGLNGVGGYRLTGGHPTAEMTVLIDYDYGLHADFLAGTDKQLLWQFGCTAQNCVAMTLPRLHLNDKPTRKPINNLSGLQLQMTATEPTVAASPDNLYSAAMGVHWF